MSRQVISFSVSPEEYQNLLDDQKASGTPTITDFVRQLIVKRNQDVIVLDADAEQVRQTLTAKLEAKDELIRTLTEQVSATSRQGALSGVETKSTSVKAQIEEAVKMALDAKEREELKERVKELEAEVERLEEFEEMAEEDARADKKMQRYAGLLTAAGSLPPQVLEPIQGLLQGLGGLVTKKNGMGSLPGGSPEDEKALVLGRAIVKDFPGELFPRFLAVGQYLRDQSGELIKLSNSAKVIPYLNQLLGK